MTDRRATFKKTLGKGEAAHKRIESATRLQKDKRDKSINSKRSRRDENGMINLPLVQVN
jgi:hypothetical protein